MLPRPLRIGTRASPMALSQTGFVRDRIAATNPDLADALELVPVTTVADKVLDRPLAEIGGKGLFTKELEQALFSGEIDLAVHSMKDVETWLPDGLVIASVLPRHDPRDAFLSPHAGTLAGLAPGSRVGTSSLRRAAQVLIRRPDLTVVPLRGNANTRLRKLEEGACEATLLAISGLERIGLADRAQAVMSVEEMLPAVAQGALGIECRAGDDELIARLGRIACPTTTAALAAERAMLADLDGSCRTPIAGLAEIADGTLTLRAMLFMPDGSAHWSTRQSGPEDEADAIGRRAGEDLRRQAGPAYAAHLQ